MKSFIKIAWLLFLPLFASAQSNQIKLGSLQIALKDAINDTIKMSVCSNLAQYYMESNRDIANIYVEQALLIANKINQPLWTASLLLNKAYILQKQQNLALVFKLTTEAIDIAKDEKNEKNIYLDEVYGFIGDPHKIRLEVIAGGYHQLGNLYRQVGNKEKSIAYYRDEIRVADAEELKSEDPLVNSYMNIGSIYNDLDKLDSAQFYTNKAIAYSNSTGHKTYQGFMLNDIGKIYFKRKQLDSAKYYYWKSLSVSREQNNLTDLIEANISLAKYYESAAKLDSMLYYAQAAFYIGTSLKTPIATTAQLVSNAFKMQRNTDSAFAYLSISKTVGDSLNKVRNEKLTQFQTIYFEEQLQFEKTAQENIVYKNKIRTIGLFIGLAMLSVLAFVFYRNNRQKQKANAVLETTITNLKAAQAQLIQSEKMASLGELTAGIAHEIQNPLNFVNNFSEVNKELLEELKVERQKPKAERDERTEAEIIEAVIANSEKINHHGKRADTIVKGMLQHSRSSNGQKEPTNINVLADEYLRLSYHGLRAKDKSFNATLKTDFDETIGNINIIPQDVGRVLLNLITNAFYVVAEKKKNPHPLKEGEPYEPTITITTKKLSPASGNGGKVLISVKDNGNGIPPKVIDKIFQPFFTTKPTGQGTGLGLSLSYDIVKAHGGEINVNTKDNEGTEFIISLPL